MNEQFKKKFATALWLMFATFVAQLLTYIADNIAEFGLGVVGTVICLGVCTAGVATLTKILNK